MNQTPLEEDEQEAFVEWLELKGLKFTAIPNSTFTTSQSQKAKNKAMGLRAGLPDLLIVLPTNELLFIEMKRKKGSKTSSEQEGWIEALNKVDNVGAFICFGADEAIKTVEQYLI